MSREWDKLPLSRFVFQPYLELYRFRLLSSELRTDRFMAKNADVYILFCSEWRYYLLKAWTHCEKSIGTWEVEDRLEWLWATLNNHVIKCCLFRRKIGLKFTKKQTRMLLWTNLISIEVWQTPIEINDHVNKIAPNP